MEGLSKRLGLIKACVHPHESRTALAPPPNLDENQVSRFSGSSHLVAIPGHDGVVGVCRVDDVESTDGSLWDSAGEGDYVSANDVTS